jgi:hypothetical protein
MSIDYTHCLRPRFVENILTHLLNGTSVNVVVPKIEEEADRLTIDVQNCQLPNTRVLAVNMRFCRGNYRQFLLDLWHQYYQQPTQKVPNLFTFLTELERATQQFIIVLNHLDAMSADEVDPQFDQDFYGYLNSLKNYRNVALLVITKGTSYHGMLFNIGGELKASKLDIQEIEDLPPLFGEEARYELSRRHPDLSTVHISHLLQQGQHQELGYDYALLDYLSKQLRHSVEPWDDMTKFIRQLKRWHKRYKRQPKQSGYWFEKIIQAIKKIFTIFNIKALFKQAFSIFKLIIADPFIILAETVKDWVKKKRQ